MRISIVKSEASDSFLSPELQTRAKESSKTPQTTHYRVLANDREVAFVSLGRPFEARAGQMVLYEIFVKRDMRRKGIGTAVLSGIETMAMREGFRKMRLRPSPLDRETSQWELVSWYLREGYDWELNSSGNMEKQLHSTGSGAR